MREEGLPVELLETRHVRTAFKTMPVKTDRKDARGIAQLMRMGWFRPVHCKSMPAQEMRALLTTRKLVLNKRIDVEMGLRGILRGFGLTIGPTTPRTFETRVRALVDRHPSHLNNARDRLKPGGKTKPVSHRDPDHPAFPVLHPVGRRRGACFQSQSERATELG
jgi:transposase